MLLLHDDFKSSRCFSILDEYNRKINNYSYIAYSRNKILSYKCGKLPSYALWTDDAVAEESCTERFEWFVEMLPTIYRMYKNMYYSPISLRYIGLNANEG